jgi:hypothetical protein
MRRAHRTAHRALWPLLAVAIALGIIMALVLRPAPARHMSQTSGASWATGAPPTMETQRP